MSFNFNKITEETEKATVAKFRENGQGVSMSKNSTSYSKSYNVAKWDNLVDSKMYSIGAIRDKMLEIARYVNTQCNDDLLGDMSVAFRAKDFKGKTVAYTHVDLYTFLRAAYRFRKESSDYRRKLVELEEAKRFIEDNKSQDQKLKDAEASVKKLEAELA